MTLRENEKKIYMKNRTSHTKKKKRQIFTFLPCHLLACPRVKNKYAQNDTVNKDIKDNEKETQNFKRD